MVKIIGAGPIGCYTALMLAKEKEVSVYEEHKETGTPIQCTGILSQSIHKFMRLKKDFVANKIYSTRVYSPDKNFLKIDFKKPNIIVYRDKFDQYFRDEALRKGAKIIYNSRFNGKEIVNLKTRKRTKLKFDYLIGADGPLSKVSESFGFGKRKLLPAVQALIKKKNDNVVDFYPFIGTYAWAVPESESVLRVGVAAYKDTNRIFKDFIKKYPGKILAWQSGAIPIFKNGFKAQKDNVFLVGDSAAQIKNTTGGGLIPGMTCAKELSKAIIKNKNYDTLWKKNIGKSLVAHKLARDVLDRFSEKDWNKLIKILNKKSSKEVLSSKSRDEPIKLISSLLLKNPGLLSFIRRII
jgi:flavin-dependent dehydrogenase